MVFVPSCKMLIIRKPTYFMLPLIRSIFFDVSVIDFLHGLLGVVSVLAKDGLELGRFFRNETVLPLSVRCFHKVYNKIPASEVHFTSRPLTNSMSHIGGGRIATSSSNEQHHVNSRPPPSTRASLPLTSSAHHPEFCAGKAAVLTKTHSCHCPKAPLLEMTTQISNQDTPDPWMIKYNGTYMLTFTTGDRVEIWRSSLLHDFHDNVAAKRVVW